MVDLKKIIHNEDHDPIPSNYTPGQDAYGRRRAKDGIIGYMFLPLTVALVASIGASEFWLMGSESNELTFNKLFQLQTLATVVACLFGARGLGRRLLSGFLVWCVFSVHIVVLASEGRIELAALLSPYFSQEILNMIPFV